MVECVEGTQLFVSHPSRSGNIPFSRTFHVEIESVDLPRGKRGRGFSSPQSVNRVPVRRAEGIRVSSKIGGFLVVVLFVMMTVLDVVLVTPVVVYLP